MRALAILAAGMLVGSVHAETKKNIAMMGIGTSTCTQFANLYKLDSMVEDTYFSWAQGFLSGFNMVQINMKKGYLDLASLDTKTQQEYLRAYCDQHPLGDYIDAVMDLSFRFESAQRNSK